MRQIIGAGIVLVAGTLPAGAAVLDQAAEVQLLASGGYCVTPPDALEVAPGTREGQVSAYDLPYDFLITGDSVPSIRDLGVGVVLRVSGLLPGEWLTVQQGRIGEPGVPDTWRLLPGPDGSFWFGGTPDPGTRLIEGTYRFSVFRGREPLLTFDIEVTTGPTDEVCVPEIA